MKYFKFWIEKSFNISVGNQLEEINVLAGSNVSKHAATLEADERAKKIEQRIAERLPKESYEVAIKEHVDEILDDSNIISICRYGAKVLNTEQYTILDLDDYPIDFFDCLKPLRKLSRKERIVFKFEEKIERYPILGTDFRIYETTKGIRVIGKKYFEPAGKEYRKLMRKLNVDWIYIQLSQKQRCYRARITPKPYRMKFRTIKVTSPLICETENYQNWATEYEEKSRAFSVVRLIKTIGNDFQYDRVIQHHDRVCNASANNKLA